MIQNDEDVVKAGYKRLTRNLRRLLALSRLAGSDLQPDVEGDGDMFEEDVAAPLGLFGIHASCGPFAAGRLNGHRPRLTVMNANVPASIPSPSSKETWYSRLPRRAVTFTNPTSPSARSTLHPCLRSRSV
jgi:hypothetical protein